MEQNPSSSRAAERKTSEKNRRNQMKDLYSKLHSLVPRHSSREVKPLTGQLDEAANYIKNLKLKLEKMKEKRESLMGIENTNSSFNGEAIQLGFKPPQIDIHEVGCALVVNLITCLDASYFMFCQIIRMLHEEGVEILNANFSVKSSGVFHTIHAKVGDYAPGCGGAMISARLKKFVDGAAY